MTCFKRNTGLSTFAAIGLALSASSPAAAQVELDFWDMIWGPPEYIDTAEAIVDQFNEEHPDIQVTYRSVPWANWYQTYVSAVGAGSAPDISTGAGYQAVQLYELGAIRPLDDMIQGMRDAGDLEDFQEGTVDVLQYDDHYVALPWGIDIRVWYYRKSLLQEAGVEVPSTWAEFSDAAAAVVDSTDAYGLVSSGDTGGTHFAYTAMLNNGGGLFDEDRNIDLTSDRNMEAMNWYGDMVANDLVHPASAGYSSDDRRSAFFQGQAAFTLDGPGLPLEASDDIVDDIGVLPPLEGPNGDTGTIFWINNIMMYNQTEHPEEAETFLRWWSANQLPLWTEGNTSQLPVRASFIEPGIGSNETKSYVVENYVPLGQTTATKSQGIFPELSEIEGEGVMQTLIQRLWQGQPVDEIMAEAEERMQSIME